MSFIIGILTFFLVVNCLLLILLVLIQLPKKEAGMGSAFGGGTTEALFGAGSGNVLTKLTKFAAGSFLIICFGLSVMIIKNNGDASAIDAELEKVSGQAQMEAAQSAVESGTDAGAEEAASSESVTVTSSTTNGISASATVSGAAPEAAAAAEDSETAGSLEQLINNIQEETEAATDQVVETAEDLLNTGAAAVEEVVTPEATTEPEPEPEPEPEAESVPEAVEAPATDSSVEAPQP